MAELGLDFESHFVNLNAGENATDWYQAIHPGGVVPALASAQKKTAETDAPTCWVRNSPLPTSPGC